MGRRFQFLVFFLTAFLALATLSPKMNVHASPVQLTTSPDQDREPEWSPDGEKIVYVAFSGGWYRHIWVMNNDGSGKTQLTSGNIVDGAPAYSPNGTKIAFLRHGFRGDYNDLMLMDANGSNVQRLTFGGISGLAEGTYNWPQWSTDGSTLLFGYGEGTTGVPWDNKPFWICTMKTDGTDLTVLGRGINPRFIFDDTKILFNTDHYQGADMKIAIMDADGIDVENLTDGPADHSPDMGSDSQRIVFIRAPMFGELGDLYVMNVHGSNQIQLTDDGLNLEGVWSPEEEYIAYVSERSGNRDIWTMEAPSLLYELTVTSSPTVGITFTINATQQATPYTEELPEGVYILEMPETHNGYIWSHWLEDEDINRIKTIHLNGTTWTAIYEEELPAPVGGTAVSIDSTGPSTWIASILLLISVIAVSSAYINRKKSQI